MTVASVQNYIEYAGDGATQTFSVPFYFLLNSDIDIIVSDASGNLSELTYGVDYSASGAGNADGGSVTLNTAYDSTKSILIFRNPPETQETKYYENGKFPARSHEAALDKLTMLIQKFGWDFDALSLKRPNFFANYYDAKGRRISNLADPKDQQDAVTQKWALNEISKAVAASSVDMGSLANTTSQALGDALIGVRQPYLSAVGTTQHEFNSRQLYFADWGVKGDGITDDTAAIQRACNEAPSGSTISFGSGTYLFSNITLSKAVRIKGNGFQQGGTVFLNNSATNPFFKATGTGNIKIDSFYAKPSVTPTGGSWFQFTKCFRVEIESFFLENYFLGFEFDGDGTINIDKFGMYTSVVNQSGSGGMRFGKTNYTGSVNIDNGYMKKLDDSISGYPEFGIRLGYVDVVNIGPGMTIIQHGKNLFIDPHDAQFASLIRSAGAMYDTSTYGIFIQPYNNGRVQACEFASIYCGATSVAAMAIDGTKGLVYGLTITGGDFLSNPIGIDVTGSGCSKIIINGAKVSANTDTGIHLTNSANVIIKDCIIGDASLSGNTTGLSLDVTVAGKMFNNVFTNNTTNMVGSSVSMSVFDNVGIDNWSAFSPVVTAQTGTITTVSGTLRYRRSFNTVYVNAEVTITTNGTGANSVLVTLPYTVRTHATGTGRAQLVSGKGLQVFAAAGGTNMAIRNSSDGSYPGANGELLVVSLVYETQS